MKRTLCLLLLALVALTACTSSPEKENSNVVSCPQDAKICSDGTTVVRGGPQCEFAHCPQAESPIQEKMDRWKTVVDEKSGLHFKYPDPLEAKYIRLLTEEEFKPSIDVKAEPFSCDLVEPSEATGFIKQEKKQLNNHDYCIKLEADAAAGTNYLTYTYQTLNDQKLIALRFTLGEVNCLNYDSPQQDECLKERSSFNPDTLAIQILSTLTFNSFLSK